MPHYLVERTAPDQLALLELAYDAEARRAFIEHHARDGAIWLHSSVAPDGKRSFCLYEAPNPAVIRLTAQRDGLPIDRITEVLVIGP